MTRITSRIAALIDAAVYPAVGPALRLLLHCAALLTVYTLSNLAIAALGITAAQVFAPVFTRHFAARLICLTRLLTHLTALLAWLSRRTLRPPFLLCLLPLSAIVCAACFTAFTAVLAGLLPVTPVTLGSLGVGCLCCLRGQSSEGKSRRKCQKAARIE
ncbi:hypothetical protein OAS19_05555 [Altererythrobacter sp.]|nr:hypothetical protein [Altererythrobacter sp.]